MAKIGFIGLGIMGKPMSKNLLDKGCELMVNDVNPVALKEVEGFGGTAATLKEIAENCEIIFTILPTGDIVKSVLFDGESIAKYAKKGSLVVDMSSVTPNDSIYCCEKLAEYGIEFLDCPVSGGEPGAIDATLAMMAGGTQENFDRALPYLQKMGKSAVLIGKTGSGSVTKLANQIIVNLGIAAVAEAFVLVSKAGADPAKVYEAIRGGLAGSTVLDAKAPMMMDRNFKPGGKISINHKDIKNVMSAAHDLDVPLNLTAQLFEIMQTLKVHGHMDDDHSGIVQYYEYNAGVEVRRHKEV